MNSKEREREKTSSLCPCSLEFLGDTGGRIGIINYDLLQWQRLRLADYLTVMSARYNYIYISFVMEYRAGIAAIQRTKRDVSEMDSQGNWVICPKEAIST